MIQKQRYEDVQQLQRHHLLARLNLHKRTLRQQYNGVQQKKNCGYHDGRQAIDHRQKRRRPDKHSKTAI